MTDPKIKYDIEANVSGDADVGQLEKTLRGLSTTLEGDLQKSAVDAANALEALGAKKQAIDSFQALKRETADLAREMDSAAAKVADLGEKLPAATSATARFSQAETAAGAALAATKADLEASRAALVALNKEYTGAARGTDEYKEASTQLRVSISTLREGLKSKRTELTDATAATRQAQAAEKSLTTEYNSSVSAARSVSTALGSKNRALEESRAAMQQVGIQATNLASAEKNLDNAIDAVRVGVLALAPAYRAAASASAASTQTQVQNQRTLSEGFSGLQSQLQRIQQVATVAVGGGYVGGLIKDVAATADEFKNLESRIKLVTGEGQQFQEFFSGVAEVALRTNSALDDTATLFARVAKAGTESGLSAQAAQQQALALTSTINQAIQLSGSSVDASKAAVTQLIQGLQSGVLRGEEFNSVMEQAPRLAEALASGLGRTTGELRKMADQGALTTDVVIKALRGQSDAVAAEFDKLPPTVGRALQNLSTQWTLYVGAADNGLLSSSNAAKVVDALARNLDTLVSTLYAAGKAYAAIKIAGLAGDALKWAAATVTATSATVGSTAALAANTAATATNTTVKVANTVAAAAGATAQTALGTTVAKSATEVAKAGVVWRGFSALLGPLGVAAAVLGPEILGLAEKAGVAAARWMGWGKVMDENEAKLRAQDKAAKELAESSRLLAVASADAAARQFGLSKEAAAVVSSFDVLRKNGDSAADAIGKIGKDFDLANSPGIRNATGVLDKLLTDGKLTAAEFQAAWAKALDGKDLLQFEVTARAALAGTAREAERLQQIMDAGLREAVKRSGLEFTALQGNIGSASRSAINDVDLIIRQLDSLKTQGIDAGRVLSASISKAIDTADSEKALGVLRTQIEGLRAQLGSTVTNGLLDQAAEKARALTAALDAAKPGINSVAEAMKSLGITSDDALKKTAAQSKEAYDFMVKNGTSSARELSEAFVRTANEAIAANNGIAPSWVQSQAAVRGLEVAVDSAGKAIVRNMSDSRSAVAGFGSQVQLTNEDLQRQIALLDAINAKYSKPKSSADQKDAQNPYGKTSDGFTANKDGSAAGTFTNTLVTSDAFALVNKAKAGNLSAADLEASKVAYQQAQDALQYMQALGRQDPGGQSAAFVESTQALYNATRSAYERVQALAKEADRVKTATTTKAANSGSTSTTATNTASTTSTVNHVITVPINGTNKTFSVASSADVETVKTILAELAAAKSAAGL